MCINGSCKVKFPCVLKFDQTHEHSMIKVVRELTCLLFKYEVANWCPIKPKKRSRGKPKPKENQKPPNRWMDIEVVNDVEL